VYLTRFWGVRIGGVCGLVISLLLGNRTLAHVVLPFPAVVVAYLILLESD
jgi:hypothetical protein